MGTKIINRIHVFLATMSSKEVYELRKRNVQSHKITEKTNQSKEKTTPSTCNANDAKLSIKSNTYWLTRIIILRAVAFVYFVAFLVALNQNRALIGKNGLLPADKYLKELKPRIAGSALRQFQSVPTLLWFFDYENNIDELLTQLSCCGLLLSAFIFINGGANIFIMLSIWILYHSIVNVGQRWYSFGWESQLLETGFLAAFLCPLLSISAVPKATTTPFVAILGYRWLLFRIMIGAGLIKIRGDQCWRDLTCMNYHYETQPVPNPMAFYMHQEPELLHKAETLGNHFIELIAPFFLFLNRRMRLIGGFLQVIFQTVLIISGNLSFLNWLTIIPALACFDDRSVSWMFSSKQHSVKWKVSEIQKAEKAESGAKLQKKSVAYYIRQVLNISFGCLIAFLSIPIVQNLLSSRQIMNTSFDTLRIVNTYGAFGSITKERTEVVFQGTYADNPNDINAKWEEYEFNCKPGSVHRRPCLISPYHYRLDWLMWFAAFQNYQYNDWLVHLAAKFLVNDEDATSLIAHNPFQDKDPPKFVRALHYRYKFTKIGSKDAQEGKWWNRIKIGEYLPPVNTESLKGYMSQMGWKTRKSKKKKQF